MFPQVQTSVATFPFTISLLSEVSTPSAFWQLWFSLTTNMPIMSPHGCPTISNLHVRQQSHHILLPLLHLPRLLVSIFLSPKLENSKTPWVAHLPMSKQSSEPHIIFSQYLLQYLSHCISNTITLSQTFIRQILLSMSSLLPHTPHLINFRMYL